MHVNFWLRSWVPHSVFEWYCCEFDKGKEERSVKGWRGKKTFLKLKMKISCNKIKKLFNVQKPSKFFEFFNFWLKIFSKLFTTNEKVSKIHNLTTFLNLNLNFSFQKTKVLTKKYQNFKLMKFFDKFEKIRASIPASKFPKLIIIIARWIGLAGTKGENYFGSFPLQQLLSFSCEI